MGRNVFSNDMVAHVWAQQNQDEGRSNNGQFYFTGPRIYSYGSHFVAGFIDKAGRAWVNADNYSNTTAKHMGYVRRAVAYRYFSVPALTRIVGAIESIGDKSRAAYVARELSAYLDSHWRAFDADSEAGAILWAAIKPRASWPVEHAKRTKAGARLADANAKAAKRHAIAHAKEVAAIPLSEVRLRMVQTAMNNNDYAKARQLKDAVSFYQDAHRGSEPGKVRAAIWERVKLARELAARLDRSKANATRAAIVTLRRIWTGGYGAGYAGTLNLALEERKNLNAALAAHMPPATRARLESRLADVQADINRHEAERNAARFAEQAANRAAWLAGESVRDRYSLTDERGGALVRAYGVELDGCNVTAGTLETSQGATVPLRHAVRIFAFVRSIRESGRPWQGDRARPVRVGHFTLDSVSASGDFVAGCHVINWNETERLARELGVWDCPATALAANEMESA